MIDLIVQSLKFDIMYAIKYFRNYLDLFFFYFDVSFSLFNRTSNYPLLSNIEFRWYHRLSSIRLSQTMRRSINILFTSVFIKIWIRLFQDFNICEILRDLISVFRRSGWPADHHSHDVLRNDNPKLSSSSIGILDLVSSKKTFTIMTLIRYSWLLDNFRKIVLEILIQQWSVIRSRLYIRNRLENKFK